MSTGEPFTPLTTVVMYGPAPQPGDERNPWTPVQPIIPGPFTPGVQPVPADLPARGLTQATGGAEPLEQIVSRLRARIGQIEAEIGRVELLRVELDGLQRMLAALVPPVAAK